MASPNPFVAGPTGDEHDAEPVEYVHELKHADVPAEPVDSTERVGTLDDYLADWWDETTWYDVLHPAGWTRNRPDNCGCQTWTRPHAPGESVTPKSLTAHEVGCQRGRTDALHPAGHVWSDHVDGALADMVTAQGRTLSAFAIYTALHHDGDYGEACRAVGIPARHATSLAHLGTNFDDSELWDAAPWLSRVRDNARRLWVDRYALLIAVLSEVALLVPPDYVMSGDGLRNVSLNTFVLLVGPPGGGKGKVLDHAQNVVKPVNTFTAGVDGPTTVKGWTGEGMGQAFNRRNDKPVGDDDEPDPSVLPLSKRFREDEVANLIAKMQAKNSTIIGYANSAFFGEGMGSGLADRTQSHYVDPHTYRMALQIAAQLGTVLPLFTDTALASGFTARLLVADTRVRRSETTSEGTVDMTPIKVDRSTIVADPLPGTAGLQAIRTDDSLLAMIAEQAGAANVLDDDADPAEVVERDDAAGHRALLQRNVATLLAIASGDELVGWDHWQLAGHVIANSQRVQRQLQVAAKAARVEAKVAESREQAEVEQRALTDRADAVVEWARSNCPPGGVKWSALRSGKPSVGRHWSPEVHKQVRELLADGYDERVTVVEVGQGYRIEVRPAGVTPEP